MAELLACVPRQELDKVLAAVESLLAAGLVSIKQVKHLVSTLAGGGQPPAEPQTVARSASQSGAFIDAAHNVVLVAAPVQAKPIWATGLGVKAMALVKFQTGTVGQFSPGASKPRLKPSAFVSVFPPLCRRIRRC